MCYYLIILLYTVQICLQSSTLCENWLGIAFTSSFMTILLDFIHYHCDSSIVIYSPTFSCSGAILIFSGHLLTLSEYCSAMEIIQEWVMSTPSVMVQGKLFQVDADCPVAAADSQ